MLRQRPPHLGQALTFHDNALDVEIAQKNTVCIAEAEAFEASSGAVSRTRNMQTGDCTGDAWREQGTDPSQLKLTLNSDGACGFSAPGWGSMKLKICHDESCIVIDGSGGCAGPADLRAACRAKAEAAAKQYVSAKAAMLAAVAERHGGRRAAQRAARATAACTRAVAAAEQAILELESLP